MVVSFLSNAQTKSLPVYVITPEINKKIIEKNPSVFDVHKIKTDKIKYKVYEPAELITYEYDKQEKLVANYKRGYDKFMQDVETANFKKEGLIYIIENIQIFQESNDKYDVKKELLIDAQKIADKYEIKIRTRIPSSSIFEANTYDRELLIYRENKKPNNDDLKIIMDEIYKIKEAVKIPGETEESKLYRAELLKLEKIKKTVPGFVLSTTEAEREVKIVEEELADLETFKGTFTSKQVYMVLKNSEDWKRGKSFVKNELLEPKSYFEAESSISDIFGKPGYILEEVSTHEEYFYPMEKGSYISSVADFENDKNFLKLLHDLGYKEYLGADNKMYIKTKTTEIEIRDDDNFRYTIEADKTILSSFDNDRIKLKALVKQCTTYTNSLNDFLSIYNIKRTNTPLATVNQWRTTTLNASKLVSQIDTIIAKYAFIYDLSREENLQSYDNFLQKLVASQKVLGI
jgi:hypothetical protein